MVVPDRGTLMIGGLTSYFDEDAESSIPIWRSIPIVGNLGSLKIKGLKSDARIDSRNAEVEVAMAAPAPVAIYGNGERISLTPPPGGYTLDARVTDGRVTPDDFIESMGFTTGKPSDSQQTVSGAIKGGGPTISVRATNADFTVRQAEDKTRPSEKPDTKS